MIAASTSPALSARSPSPVPSGSIGRIVGRHAVGGEQRFDERARAAARQADGEPLAREGVDLRLGVGAAIEHPHRLVVESRQHDEIVRRRKRRHAPLHERDVDAGIGIQQQARGCRRRRWSSARRRSPRRGPGSPGSVARNGGTGRPPRPTRARCGAAAPVAASWNDTHSAAAISAPASSRARRRSRRESPFRFSGRMRPNGNVPDGSMGFSACRTAARNPAAPEHLPRRGVFWLNSRVPTPNGSWWDLPIGRKSKRNPIT